jgi:hypothetical protein
MSSPVIPLETRLLAALELSTKPDEVETFSELFDTIRFAQVLGPDDANTVWLSGLNAEGRKRAVDLGDADGALGRAALRWRDERQRRDVRH